MNPDELAAFQERAIILRWMDDVIQIIRTPASDPRGLSLPLATATALRSFRQPRFYGPDLLLERTYDSLGFGFRSRSSVILRVSDVF